ncbi:hypothetical protein [Brevundimonas sp.]|uniref:hypothetical protein n=1 Tax=Brevundimonas sp. TaxID=1871086 RepID=UPI003D0B5D67
MELQGKFRLKMGGSDDLIALAIIVSAIAAISVGLAAFSSGEPTQADSTIEVAGSFRRGSTDNEHESVESQGDARRRTSSYPRYDPVSHDAELRRGAL